MKICAHVLLKNEARFAWYSIMSVLHYVDSVRIWDMGSSDGTQKIIEAIQKTNFAKRLDLFEFKTERDKDFLSVRQAMLNATTEDWVFVLDADEVWWDSSIRKVINFIRKNGEKYESIVVPTINMVGDMFHHQEKEAGRYHLAGRVGHYNTRAFSRSIAGLHGEGEHGVFRWVDENGIAIENRDKKKIKLLEAPYMHMTHLARSTTKKGDLAVLKRRKKLKYEIGESLSKDFYYPEVFFRDKPSIIPSVWEPTTKSFKTIALVETPLRKIYRRTILKFKKHGY